MSRRATRHKAIVTQLHTNKTFYTKPEKEIKFKNKLYLKNHSQELLYDTLHSSTMTFCVGPAGTGKTYIMTRVALEKLLQQEITRIVITRPVVEADEKLGFLPGSLEDKINPYLLPILDCIEDHIGPVMTTKLLQNGKIEIAPLAYMRGRTFNNAFVILDEAQNTTKGQMKMFLTRIGNYSYFAINGDLSQSDLCKENGLKLISEKLVDVNNEISLITFKPSDIVRNPIIETILKYIEN